MIEVCDWGGTTSAMKHPSPSSEKYVLNLGKATQLRCRDTKVTTCGRCEACTISTKLSACTPWFANCGDHTRRRFVLGLIRRVHSVDLLELIVNVLRPVVAKDFTYARSRSSPSLKTDAASVSGDRAMPPSQIETGIAACWDWFLSSNYWTKANFVMSLLQLCDVHLIHAAGTQAATLLTSEKNASIPTAEFEAASIATTDYSYRTTSHPELDLLSRASRQYSTVSSTAGDHEELVKDDSDEESDLGSIDPTCMVVPTSAKAHAGVAKHKDFVRCLPIHLSKCILGYLDQGSLNQALLVSKRWCGVAKEVHNEFYINKGLQEEVMLMQGASAQGANPVYANDIDVPVPNLANNHRDIVTTGERQIVTTFKSEVSYETAYSGVSTRRVIMEERNVYCGAYNIMVLTNETDPNRVIHTDGGKLIATGSKDRKVRFIDSETTKDYGPVITGHAGSVRCVCLAEERKFVLSGSYDTSVRMWCLETGQCLKIFRAHTDSIMTVIVYKDKMISGSRDGSCKIWNLLTAKCTRTFKHKAAVMAVALGEIIADQEICVTGDEAGMVKVWDVTTAQLIKRLEGHRGQVTGISFDRWHIVTGSKDGYALSWSTQGNHDKCLVALRHPNEVLCVEFMYLRVITGSADGKLRIWNMISGQCLRIMRGNSRSDPIQQIIAIADRITLNTVNNLLVLKFEQVDWDYTLADDKMPPLVQYSQYSDAPIRQQPYPYVRAQRMNKAGATNTKITHRHAHGRRPSSHGAIRQIEHSAKTLTDRNIQSARTVQNYIKPDLGYDYMAEDKREELRYARVTGTLKSGTAMSKHPTIITKSGRAVSDMSAKPPLAPGSARSGQPKSAGLTNHSSPTSRRPGTSPTQGALSVTLAADPPDIEFYDENGPPESYLVKRRISWAFEPHDVPKSKELNLSETKSLLRSQIRQKGNIVPPDFVYLTVNNLQNSQKANETTRNTRQNVQERTSRGRYTSLNRPWSSPSKVDPRAKVPVEEMGLEDFMPSVHPESVYSVETTTSSMRARAKANQAPPEKPDPTAKVYYTAAFQVTPTEASPHVSLYSKQVKSSIPQGCVYRPQTTGILKSSSAPDIAVKTRGKSRPVTAPDLRVTSAGTLLSCPSRTKKVRHGYSAAATQISATPMLMYPEGYHEKMNELKERKAQQQASQLSMLRSSSEPSLGKVSRHNDPLRRHVEFKLLSHEQEVEKEKAAREKMDETRRERGEGRERRMWLAKAKGQLANKDYTKRPKSVAPEIREYWEYTSSKE